MAGIITVSGEGGRAKIVNPFAAPDTHVPVVSPAIPGTVYLISRGWFWAGAFWGEGFAGLFLQYFYEFGDAERAPGSIVSPDRLRPVAAGAAGQVGFPVGYAIEHGLDDRQDVVRAFEVRPRARPWPFAGVSAQSGGNRITFDISDCGKQVIFIQQKGVKPLLPQVTAPTLAEINMPNIMVTVTLIPNQVNCHHKSR
ncbi:MAG: hypothetical protein OES20_12975 [Gammaproteobacteria bacterium]|nr:hypothetical protein [Gammaproteobacteria bacterium]